MNVPFCALLHQVKILVEPCQLSCIKSHASRKYKLNMRINAPCRPRVWFRERQPSTTPMCPATPVPHFWTYEARYVQYDGSQSACCMRIDESMHLEGFAMPYSYNDRPRGSGSGQSRSSHGRPSGDRRQGTAHVRDAQRRESRTPYRSNRNYRTISGHDAGLNVHNN